MAKTRKQYTPHFKLKAVVEVLKGDKTATQLAGELGVHPVILSEWKKQFTETGAEIFAKRKKSKEASEAKEQAELFEQIGRLKMENEWLKKKLDALS
jgi:transposase-like protein